MNEQNTPDGATRVHFETISVGMSPTLCGRLTGPNDALRFARMLQELARAEPGCGGCEITRVDLVRLVDVDLELKGRWRSFGLSWERDFQTYMPEAFVAADSPEARVEHAHFYVVRDGAPFEVFYDALCPGSDPDPDGESSRVVSERCAEFSQSPAGEHMLIPGLLVERP